MGANPKTMMPRLVFGMLALAAIINSSPLATDEIIPEDDFAEESVMYSSYSSHYSAPMYSSYSSHYSAPMYSSYSSHYSAPTTTPATTTRRTSRRSHRRRARRWRRRMEKSLIPHFVKNAAKRCGCGHFNPIPKCIRKHTPKVCKRCGNCIARKLGKRGGWRYIINQLHKVSRRMKRVHAFKRRVVARRMRMFAHCHKECKRLVKKQKASRKEYKKCYKA